MCYRLVSRQHQLYTPEDKNTISDFDDFCLYVYVIVDDLCQQMATRLRRPGPAPQCSDSELVALCLIGECKGWDVETELLSNMQAHRDLFPHLPEQSRFNRRRRQLMFVVNTLRRLLPGALWAQLDLAQDQQCVIDSLPIPVVQFHLVPGSKGDWPAYDAHFGKVPTKKQTIYGYKLHLLLTLKWADSRFRARPGQCHRPGGGL